MGELFGVGAGTPLCVSIRFRDAQGRGTYREEGWGVAALQGGAALTLKAPTPRPDAPTARMLAEGRALRGEGALAYIRRWTHSASLANCHPFVRELGGREWAFAHNGSVPGLRRELPTPPGRFRPVGGTDSEHAFCVLLDALEVQAAGPGPADPAAWAQRLLQVLHPVSARIARHGMFNYLLLGERCLVAFSSGEYGLYLLALESAPRVLVLEDEDWRIEVEPDAPACPCVLVASNPMTPGDWRRLGAGELIVIADGRTLAAHAPAPPPARRARRPPHELGEA